MARPRMLWLLFLPSLLITILAVVAVAEYAVRSQRRFILEQTSVDLEARARLIAAELSAPMAAGGYDRVDSLCKTLGKSASMRLTVMLPSGRVVGDTEEDPTVMENHARRPEMVTALSGQTGTSTRFSNTLQRTMIYVAVPLPGDGALLGVVRTSLPIAFTNQHVRAIHLRMAGAGLLVALVAALISLYVARRISRPLEQLRQGAERFAGGDLDSRLPIPPSDEIGALAEAMNTMAGELSRRIGTITQQRNEQEAILSSMAEGVLAVDQEGRIMTLNRAAARFFEIDADKARKRTLHEAIRNTGLQEMAAKILRTRKPAEDEVVVDGKEKRFLLAAGMSLYDADRNVIGAVIVLNDVTRIRHLESLRRDFVANVSHELKTPVTSIKGFVETLLHGAVQDPEDTNRFLKIIAKHTDRLKSIIDDLLSLSSVEQGASIALKEVNLEDIIRSAIQACEQSARARDIHLHYLCPPDIRARVNPQLLEQAMINLVDNSIKYSRPDTDVHVGVETSDNEITISVTDNGFGIEDKHLPRIFERFYRIDRARSRELGGTGLGLAIVKHIILAHGGRVSVRSQLGAGSTFSLHLPRLH